MCLRQYVVQEIQSVEAVGQFTGYLDEPGVAPGSTTETFVAVKFEIDSWRWAGVPFYVRAGKGLTSGATEAVVEFDSPPRSTTISTRRFIARPSVVLLSAIG